MSIPSRVSGYWKKSKSTISIKSVWSEHVFTNDELTRLFNNEYIIITAIDKSGKPFIVKGKLEEQEYHGKVFIGFLPDWGFSRRKFKINLDGYKVSLNRNFPYHTLTDSEIYTLENGGTVIYEETRLDNKVYKITLKIDYTSPYSDPNNVLIKTEQFLYDLNEES